MWRLLLAVVLLSGTAHAGHRIWMMMGRGGSVGASTPSCPAAPNVSRSQVSANDGLNARDGAAMVAADDGTLILMGGWNPTNLAEWGNNATGNTILKSTDRGANWTTVLAYAGDPPQTGSGARWRRRHSHCGFVATIDGNKYIYVIGGDGFDTYYGGDGNGGGPYPTDVWRSPLFTYGASWERMTATAAFGSRTLQMCWQQNGKLFVAGGQTCLTTACVLNDVWESRDGGETWQLNGTAPWAGRGTFANSVPVLNGQAYVLGGQQYDSSAETRVNFNDVWAFDGTTWTKVLNAAPWTARGYHNVLTTMGRVWVLNGAQQGGAMTADVWSSPDGRCWDRHQDLVIQDHAMSAAVLPADGSIVVTAGTVSGAAVWRISL